MSISDELDIFYGVGKPIIHEDDWIPDDWPEGFLLVRPKPDADLAGPMSWPEFNCHVGEVQRREWV